MAGIELDLTPSTPTQHNFYTCTLLDCPDCERLVQTATKTNAMSPRHGSQEAAREAEQEDTRMREEEQRGTAPMSHTPELWYGGTVEEEPFPHHLIDARGGTIAQFVKEVDMERAKKSVNGCAGLNPAAYRECVEVLQNLCGAVSHMEGFSHHGAVVVALKGARRALARATGGQPE